MIIFIQSICTTVTGASTCSNEETRSKRVEVKQLIKEMKKTNPLVEKHIFKSVENVALDAVIAYKTGEKKVHFLDHYDENA